MGRVLALLLVLTGVARAQAPDDRTERARAHVKAAIAYYDEARYDDAAREMNAAYELKPLPDLQYNLAQCYERMGRYDDAAKAYESYLAGKPEAPDKRQVMQRIDNLRERAKAQASGLKVTPPPAEKVVLKTIVVYKYAPPPPGRAARWAAYGLWALGAAGIAVGITYAVLAAQAANDVTNGGDPNNPMPFDGALRATQESAKTYPIISGVSFGIGGLAVAGGVALWLIGRKIDKEAPKLTLAPALLPSGGGLFASGKF
jgi:tetratricopeptide (TPR) repeat protein